MIFRKILKTDQQQPVIERRITDRISNRSQSVVFRVMENSRGQSVIHSKFGRKSFVIRSFKTKNKGQKTKDEKQ